MKFKLFNSNNKIDFLDFNEHQNTNKNVNLSTIRIRLIGMIILVIISMLLMVVRVGYLQFYEDERFERAINKYSLPTYTASSKRGDIVDRNYKTLVTNDNSIMLSQYAVSSLTDEQVLAMATVISNIIDIDTDELGSRETKDYYIAFYQEESMELVTDEEIDSLDKDNYDNQLYSLLLSKLDKEEILSSLTLEEIEIMKFNYLISNNSSGSVVLADNLSIEEASTIGTNLSLLPGVTVGTDWVRTNVYNNELKNVFGSVTSKKQGLPLEDATQLLALDYSNNSRIGTSGLEAYYESILKGVDAEYTITYDDETVVINTTSEGEKGENIRISIDWELQQYADTLLEQELIKMNNANKYFNKIFYIMSDPNTGEIIVMSGKYIDKETGEVSDYSIGNYIDANLIGSTIKGGVVYTGFKEDALSENTYYVDEPMYIQGSAVKKSWTNMGSINEIDALAYSSNVYMFHIAMHLGGTSYSKNMKLDIDPDAFLTLRSDLGDLGLGVITGLDITNESIGYKGKNTTSGNYLDAFIGQYDTYTNLQLITYTNTLATNGLKYQPHLMLDSYVVNSDNTVTTTYENDSLLINDVSEYSVAFKQIRAGMRACVTRTNGTCHKYLSGKSYLVYAKTGTAEHYDSGDSTDYPNHLQIGYASVSDEASPFISFSTICVRQNHASDGSSSSAPLINSKMLDAYVNKYGTNAIN